jgi:hypothetical protein
MARGLAAAVLAAALLAAGPAWAADGGANWVSAPAMAPAPPDGVPPSPYPLPVGYVSDIEFWQPNRGLLITSGNRVVPAGLFAYDGTGWHQLSTVCGGTDGRIAWAGPDEFWTISDQRPGQILPTGGKGALQDISLCHFKDGQVVASYALPLDQPNSYRPMNAAACDTPTDCWFGGTLDSNGAFHLHWDGTNVNVVDGPADHEIASMAVDHGQIIESVQLNPGDSDGTEDTSHPPLLHQIAPADATSPFHELFPVDTQNPTCGLFCPPLPEYGRDADTGAPVAPVTLGGLALGDDWRANPVDAQLWAAAGPDGNPPPAGEGTANPVVLRYADQAWTQVVPNLVSFPDGDVPLGFQGATPAAQSVAPEPNEGSAWIAVVSLLAPDNQAHVDRIAMTGPSSAAVTDQVALGDEQGVGPRGAASAITCPASYDCWLATQEGWLFHLTDGSVLSPDTDPNFAGVISYRPPDAGVPAVIPDQVETAPTTIPTEPLPTLPTSPPPQHRRPLVSHIGRPRLVHRTTLVLPFTLTGRARVQLVARRRGRIVAKTRRSVLRAGRHTLRLKLDPKRWPTKLALDAVAVKSGAGA